MLTWSNLSNHQILSQQNDCLRITKHSETTWIKESEEGLNSSVVTHHLDVRVFGEQSVIWHGLKERSSILSYSEPCREDADAAEGFHWPAEARPPPRCRSAPTPLRLPRCGDGGDDASFSSSSLCLPSLFSASSFCVWRTSSQGQPIRKGWFIIHI